MTVSATRICARPGCGERFSLVLRGGRNSCKAQAGRKPSYHKGRRYCSDTCRKLASKRRLGPHAQTARQEHQSSPETSETRPAEGLNEGPATGVLSTVTTDENSVDILPTYNSKKSGRASLKMTFGAYTVVPDPDWPKMYRVRRPDGSLTEMINLTRARDAARELARVAVQTEAG